MPTRLQLALLGIHLTLATMVLLSVVAQRADRDTELQILRRAAQADQQETADLVHQVAIERAILNGLRDGDPFAIELVARRKYGWQGTAATGETKPPPLSEVIPTVDR